MSTGGQHRDAVLHHGAMTVNYRQARKCSSDVISEIAREKTKHLCHLHGHEVRKEGEHMFCCGNPVQLLTKKKLLSPAGDSRAIREQ